MSNKNDKLNETIEKLEQGILNIFNSQDYKNHLKVMSKFHNYSFNNQILIYLQNPNATFLKGYKGWQNEFDRQVKKGEKGITILAPIPIKKEIEIEKKDEKGNIVKEKENVEILLFKPVTVFDISQTQGREIENLHLVEELKFDVSNFNSFFNILKSVSPVKIDFENIENGVKEYYHISENRIAINNGMSKAQTIKTAIHEIVHSILHNKELTEETNLSKNTKEIEAESVSYIVCNHFNIDTSDYSFGYIASWSENKELQELKNSLEIIKNTSSELIENIENALTETLKLQNVKENIIYKEPINNILNKEKIIITPLSLKEKIKEKQKLINQLKTNKEKNIKEIKQNK